MNPYLFIVGSTRSGTTLLQRIIDAHPQIAVVHQTHWITRYFEKRTGLTPEGFVTPKLLEYRRFPKMKVGREELERLMNSDEPVSYSSFVIGIFDLYRQRQGKSLVEDKTPSYVLNIPTLAEDEEGRQRPFARALHGKETVHPRHPEEERLLWDQLEANDDAILLRRLKAPCS